MGQSYNARMAKHRKARMDKYWENRAKEMINEIWLNLCEEEGPIRLSRMIDLADVAIALSKMYDDVYGD
jgi:hypothetical protein